MLSFSPLDVLDEIWDVIESVSKGFLTYSSSEEIAQDLHSLTVVFFLGTCLMLRPSLLSIFIGGLKLEGFRGFFHRIVNILHGPFPQKRKLNPNYKK